MTYDQLFNVLGLGVVACPTLLLAVLGVTALVGRPLNERMMSRLTQAAVVTGLLASIAILVMMLITDRRLI